jgi:hypothetical protein
MAGVVVDVPYYYLLLVAIPMFKKIIINQVWTKFPAQVILIVLIDLSKNKLESFREIGLQAYLWTSLLINGSDSFQNDREPSCKHFS